MSLYTQYGRGECTCGGESDRCVSLGHPGVVPFDQVPESVRKHWAQKEGLPWPPSTPSPSA
jgi:hypothetical protein